MLFALVQVHCGPSQQNRYVSQTYALLGACHSSTMRSSTWTCLLQMQCQGLQLMSQPGLSFTMVLLLVSPTVGYPAQESWSERLFLRTQMLTLQCWGLQLTSQPGQSSTALLLLVSRQDCPNC